MKNIIYCLLVLGLTMCAVPQEKVKIYMIGDSTMANKPLENDNQERGWGQVLPAFFNEQVTIDNHAKNGRSSKSFIDEGRWQVVLDSLKEGDYLIIQFGHNDEKADSARHTEPGSTFDANLERFIVEARSKGAKPILMNSIVRRNFSDNPNAVANDDYRKAKADEPKVDTDTLFDTHGEYKEAPKSVAKKLNVPFVDMNTLTHELVQAMGKDDSKSIYMWIEAGACAACPDGRQDNTHLNIYGAHVVARIAVREMAKEVPALAAYVVYPDIEALKK